MGPEGRIAEVHWMVRSCLKTGAGRLALLLAFSIALTGSAAAAECAAGAIMRSADPSAFVVGPYAVRFLNPDDASSPTAWEGPVAVDGPTAIPRCTLAVQGLIET